MEYYERYWKKELEEKGFASKPPEWEECNLSRIMNLIKPHCFGKVLDIGCGDGFFTSQLNNLDTVKKVTGVDISKTAIQIAEKKFAEIDFVVAPVVELPFPNESYDFVSMIEIVEHILDIEQMFKEVNRILKPMGSVVITTTDFNLLKKIIIAIFFWEKYFYPTNPHIRFFTKQTLKESLNKTGFEVFKYKWNGSYAGIMPKGQIVLAKKIKTISL